MPISVPAPPVGRSRLPTQRILRASPRWPRVPGWSRRPSDRLRSTACRWSRHAPAPARTTPTSPARSASSGRRSTGSTRRRRKSGARIVVSCGFDSVPSDLGVLELHDVARRDGAGDLEDTTLVVTALRGGVSGGTLDSMKVQVDAMKTDKALRRLVADPYALSPDREKEPRLGDERDLRQDHPGPRARTLAQPVRHGGVQHPDRAAEQRLAGLGVRPALPLPRGDGLSRRRRPGWRSRPA